MYRDIHVVSEESVNQIEVLPNLIAAEPEVVVIKSRDSEELDLMSMFDGMSEEEVEVVSFSTITPEEEMTLGESMKALFITLLDRNIQYCKEIKELKEELHAVLEDKTSMETMWEEEHDERVLAKDEVHELKHEVFELRQELKTKK